MIRPQPAQVPHLLPQPTKTGNTIPELVVTVFVFQSLFVAETVSKLTGGDVMVVDIGTLVVIVEPKLLVPIIPSRNGAEVELAEEDVAVVIVLEDRDVVDDTEDDEDCPGTAVADPFAFEDTEVVDMVDNCEELVEAEVVPFKDSAEPELLAVDVPFVAMTVLEDVLEPALDMTDVLLNDETEEVSDALLLVDVVSEVVPMVPKVLPIDDEFVNEYGADDDDDDDDNVDDVDDLVQFPMLVDDEELLLNDPLELLLDDDVPDAQGSCELVVEAEVVTASWRASSPPCWTSVYDGRSQKQTYIMTKMLTNR